MKTEEPVLEKDVVDYDFLFGHGVKLPITLDFGIGDAVREEDERWVIQLSAKPSRIDPDEKMSAETVYVYKVGLLALVVRHRKQREPTLEERFEMQQAIKGAPRLKKLSPTVQ